MIVAYADNDKSEDKYLYHLYRDCNLVARKMFNTYASMLITFSGETTISDLLS